MQTATGIAERTSGAAGAVASSAAEPRTLTVAAVYTLSEDGRKASLLAGGDGRALQQIALQVPASRLHLVSVDREGVARLKLRPRFEKDDERGVVRIDSMPVYDAPPSVEDLYRAAAKNHELESVFFSERATRRSTRGEADRALRESVAQAFLSDTTQRAVPHPPPSHKRCVIITERGRLTFDIATDQGPAKQVPAEAHRRFRADLRMKAERNRAERAAQLALHEEKKRFVAEWVAANGSEEQKGRQTAGVLPLSEAIDAITSKCFAPICNRELYTRDSVKQLETISREAGADAAVRPSDVLARSFDLRTATATQWAAVEAIRSCMPDATVRLRRHILTLKHPPSSATVAVNSVLVTIKYGPLSLRREYRI
jgi:hypothetical protein